MEQQEEKEFPWGLAGLVLLLISLLASAGSVVWVGNELAKKGDDEIWRIRFHSEFGQPADINGLDSLTRKTREFVIWEKIRDTASALATNEAIAEFASRGLENDRNSFRIQEAKSARERADKNKEILARQLFLAGKFGQFENNDQNTIYRFLAVRVSEVPEPNWINLLGSIKDLQPKP